MESEFSVYNGSIEKDPVILDNCVHTQEARLVIYPDIGWNNSHIRCASRNETNNVQMSEPEILIVYSPSKTSVYSVDVLK